MLSLTLLGCSPWIPPVRKSVLRTCGRLSLLCRPKLRVGPMARRPPFRIRDGAFKLRILIPKGIAQVSPSHPIEGLVVGTSVVMLSCPSKSFRLIRTTATASMTFSPSPHLGLDQGSMTTVPLSRLQWRSWRKTWSTGVSLSRPVWL